MIRLLLFAMLLAAPASAHEIRLAADAGGGVWDAVTTTLLTTLVVLYAAGVTRLWLRAGVGHGVPTWRATCFAGGMLTVVASLLTPLHELGDRLFVAHMAQHVLLMTVGAPLLALAAGHAATVWAVPRAARRPLAALAAPARPLVRLDVATILHGLALWSWHLPSAYALALAEEGMHWLQHASLFGSALVFWQAVLGQRGVGSSGAAIFALFLTALHSGMLGALLTFAPAPIYSGQSSAAHDWGLTLIEDQQLAGLLMWVPAGLVYALAALGLAAFWIRGSAGRNASLARPA
jgi:putative membrane protein